MEQILVIKRPSFKLKRSRRKEWYKNAPFPVNQEGD